MDVTDLPNGMYLIHLSSNSYNLNSKWIKQP
jgi:hypothetical protein